MGKHLTKNDRIKMETMLNSGHKVTEVAAYLHVHRSTIYREMKRGEYTHRNSDYTEEVRYSSDLGQKNHDWNAQGKGRSLKIGNDMPLAEYIEDKIVNDKYSPEAALAAVTQSGIEFKTSISVRTLYRYIDNGIFLKLTNKDLPIKGKRKKHNKKVKVQKKSIRRGEHREPPGGSKGPGNLWTLGNGHGKRKAGHYKVMYACINRT